MPIWKEWKKKSLIANTGLTGIFSQTQHETMK